jgi:Na+(H+)/acetate symporter ActP
MVGQTQSSGTTTLAQNISRFSTCLAVVAAFLLAPPIAKYVRPEIAEYLSTEFGSDLVYWGSWAFVAATIVASFFGCAAICQLLFQSLIRIGARKGVF